MPPAPPPPPGPGPAQNLRKSFTVAGTVVRATAYVSGVGWVNAYINGDEVAPHDRLNPGRTSFDMRQWYMAHDITKLIKSTGENAVGILLGRGWQSMNGHTPAVRLMLSITTSDGETQHVTTDTGWKGTRAGPIRTNNIYGGETYDSRMEMAGWSSTGFADSNWTAAKNADEFAARKYKVKWQPMNPIRAIE